MSGSRGGRLPNFIVAGIPTSGTTALYHYLRQHPQVFMSSIKEPTYFAAADMLSRDAFLRVISRDRAALRAYLGGSQEQVARFWVTEWDEYISLFRAVRDEVAIGEASVSYFWLPSAAPAIRAKLPGARLVFLLRHPADRLFSWYLMHRDRYPGLTFRSWFLEAWKNGGDGGPDVDRPTLPLDGGRYVAHFRRFFDNFPRHQIRVYLHEWFCADPSAVLRDLFAFLGVDQDQPLDVTQRHHETLVPRFTALDRVRRRLLRGTSVTRWLPGPARRRRSFEGSHWGCPRMRPSGGWKRHHPPMRRPGPQQDSCA